MLDDLLDEALGLKWDGVPTELRTKAYALLEGWIGEQNKEYAVVVLSALEDGDVSEKEIARILAVLVKRRVRASDPFKPIATDLLARLQSGPLTTKDVVEVAASWASGRTSDPNVQSFIQLVAGLPFSDGNVEVSILGWVQAHAGAALHDKVVAALGPEHSLQVRDLALLFGATLVQVGLLGTAPSNSGSQKQAFLNALHAFSDVPQVAPVVAIIDDLVEGKDVDAAIKLLKLFHVATDETLVRQILAGRLRDAISDGLLKLLKDEKVPDAQAKALVHAFLDIVSGKLRLVAEKTERQEADVLNDEQFRFWLRFRKVLFAAKLALDGGPVVPTDAMARPYVFQAADVRWATTRLKDLAGPKPGLFSQMVNAFATVEFPEAPHGFGKPDPLLNEAFVTSNRLVNDIFQARVLSRLP